MVLDNLTLTAGQRTLVEGLSCQFDAGERITLIGPNGSGKTTLLRTIAGLHTADEGSIQRPQSPPGMLFQEGGLWDHMTVRQHLDFVDIENDPPWREHLLEIFKLTEYENHRPGKLSAGEKIRLALARVFAGRPRWVLLDEPLSHLDPALRAAVRETLPSLLHETGATAITVTHDPDDVLLFGQRLLCLTGTGPWWLGDARLGLDSPPTATLARYSERGTLLEGLADGEGCVNFGLGISAEGQTPSQPCAAYLDGTALTLASSGDKNSFPGIFVAPDRRGGCWIQVEQRMFRCAQSPGALLPGDKLAVRVTGEARILAVESHSP
ncbi:MAG: ATP-binding cassette domain-containing protein [Planctomycetota bacterium]|nr:ATP-binding cassette domain-containing protein [Planctomycetota bacterium]